MSDVKERASAILKEFKGDTYASAAECWMMHQGNLRLTLVKRQCL
jgi:hypothetical protein